MERSGAAAGAWIPSGGGAEGSEALYMSELSASTLLFRVHCSPQKAAWQLYLFFIKKKVYLFIFIYFIFFLIFIYLFIFLI